MQVKIGEIMLCAQQVSKELAELSLANSRRGIQTGINFSIIHDAFHFFNVDYYNLDYKTVSSFVIKCMCKFILFFFIDLAFAFVPFIIFKNVGIKWDCSKVEADFSPVLNSELIFAVQYTAFFFMGYLAYRAARKTLVLSNCGALNDKVTLSAIFAIVISLTGMMGFIIPDSGKVLVDLTRRCVDQKRIA